MARRRVLTAAFTSALMVVGLGGATGAESNPAGVATAAVASQATVPTPVEPKSAHTADSDHVAMAGIRYVPATDRNVKDVAPHPGTWPAQTKETAQHEGEVSQRFGQNAVFVSTRDNPDGEIYMTDRGRTPARITCNKPVGQKSHPVLSPNGRVLAFANHHSGSWDIWVAYLDSDDPRCAESVPLTADPHDDLWPNWIDDSSLVFSSTRDNGLGNIYGVPVSDAPKEADDRAAVQLTKGPAADTMPLVIGSFVVFTTTRFRHDGSLATLALSSSGKLPADGGFGFVASLWEIPLQGQVNVPQSTEADYNPRSGYLAFTTTEQDPYGDIHIVDLSLSGGDGNHSSLRAVPWTEAAVANLRGVAESHPAWLSQGFGCLDTSGCTASDVIGYTRRSSAAHIDDMNFLDGSARKALAPAPQVPSISPSDAAGPSYSPDGRWLASSQRVSATTPARQLVIANSDGSDPRLLDYPRGPNDLDVDPVWSPDGARLAFTRNTFQTVEGGQGGYGLPTTYVLDLVATFAGNNVRRASASPQGAPAYSETNPSWAADGRQLAVDRRQALPDGNLGVSLTLPSPVVPDTQFDWSATVKNSGAVQMEPVWLDIYPQSNFAISSRRLPAGCHGTIATGHYACEVPALPPANAPNDPSAQKTFYFVGFGTSAGTAGVSATISHLPNDSYALDDSTSASLQVANEPDPSPCGCQGSGGSGTTHVSGTGTSDGSTVPDPVFARYVEAAAGTPSELWVINVEHGTSSPLQSAKACGPDCSIPGRHPSWSPDGTRIAYEDKGALKVATLGADAALPRIAAVVDPLTGFTAAGGATPSRGKISSAGDPVWSPDGSEIIFAGQPNGQPDMRGIYGVKPDGTGLRTISQEPGPETEPGVQSWADLTLTLTPTPPEIALSETSVVKATVTNNGPGRASGVRTVVVVPSGLTLIDPLPAGCTADAGTATCNVPTPLEPGGSAALEMTVRATAEGAQSVSATVSAKTPDRNAVNDKATAIINVSPAGSVDIAVALAVDRGTGWAGGKPATATVIVTNAGKAAAANVKLTIAVPGFLALVPDAACAGAVCEVGTLAPGASRTVHAQLGMPAEGPYSGKISAAVAGSVADANPADNTATAPFRVLQPRVRLLPTVSQPGKVVLAMLEDMPPGDSVTLEWSSGITSNPGEVPVDATTMTWPVLVVPGDQLGERELVVHSLNGLFGGTAGIKAPLLVVPKTVEPPGFLVRR